MTLEYAHIPYYPPRNKSTLEMLISCTHKRQFPGRVLARERDQNALIASIIVLTVITCALIVIRIAVRMIKNKLQLSMKMLAILRAEDCSSSSAQTSQHLSLAARLHREATVC